MVTLHFACPASQHQSLALRCLRGCPRFHQVAPQGGRVRDAKRARGSLEQQQRRAADARARICAPVLSGFVQRFTRRQLSLMNSMVGFLT